MNRRIEEGFSRQIPQSPSVAGGQGWAAAGWGEGALGGKFSRLHPPIPPPPHPCSTTELHCDLFYIWESLKISFFKKKNDLIVFKTSKITGIEKLMRLD